MLLSVPALLVVATLVVGSFTETRKLLAFPVQLSVGFASMLLLAWYAAPSIAEACLESLVISGLFGVGEFVVGVLSASLSSLLLAWNFSPYDYVLKPLFWVVPTGILPAFILGCIGGLILRLLVRSSTPSIAGTK